MLEHNKANLTQFSQQWPEQQWSHFCALLLLTLHQNCVKSSIKAGQAGSLETSCPRPSRPLRKRPTSWNKIKSGSSFVTNASTSCQLLVIRGIPPLMLKVTIVRGPFQAGGGGVWSPSPAPGDNSPSLVRGRLFGEDEPPPPPPSSGALLAVCSPPAARLEPGVSAISLFPSLAR